jgi:MFS family permease
LKILPISVAMIVAAVLGPRLAARLSPRKVVQIGLGFLLMSILGLMATISPTLSSVPFAVSLAGFGAGIGLAISLLGNVVMSSVGGERSSEAGGVQGASQNLGQSLGTALIGAVLLVGLTSGFHDRVHADPTIPPSLAQQIDSGTEEGLPMVSQAQFRATVEQASLPPEQVQKLVVFYRDSQVEALKGALLLASSFVLVGLWFARALPDQALDAADADDLSPEAGSRAQLAT